MLKNMKVKKSLILGYGITIVISVALIIASLMMMNNQRGQYETLMNEDVETNMARIRLFLTFIFFSMATTSFIYYLFYIYLDQFCDTLLFLHHISIPSISHISKDPPVHQSDHTLSHEIYKVFGVRGHDYRCTQAVKLSDQVKQIPYSVLVQTCGKFVQHQHGWAVDDGPGQLHPAALSQ